MSVSDFPIGSTVEILCWAKRPAVSDENTRGVVVSYMGDQVVVRPDGWEDGVAPFWPSELSLDLITTLGQLTQTRVEPDHESDSSHEVEVLSD